MESKDYGVDLQSVAIGDFWLVTQKLAEYLIENPYCTIGHWIQSISDEELTELIEIAEEQAADEDEAVEDFDNIVMIAIMLAKAEGIDVTEDVAFNSTNTLIACLTMEGLKREGYVTVDYNKVSFGEEYADAVVVTPTAKFQDYLDNLEDDE